MTNKKKMIVNLVIDESSSMNSSRAETISGFNEYIDDQKKVTDVDMLISLTKFNTESMQVFTARPVSEVKHLTEETYSPGGCTALYDAIAESIQQTEIAMQRENEDASVLFVVFTDGDENSSVEFRGVKGLESLRKIIKSKEGQGNWTFVFFGTDMDAWSAGGGLGVAVSNTMRVSRSNTRQMYSALSSSTQNRAKGVACGAMADDDFFASNRADYEGIDSDTQATDAVSGEFNNMRGIDEGDKA